VSTFKESVHRKPACFASMETKDTFMRFVVIGSIVAVGALALIVRMHA
jgi:hypothetical protein